MKDIYCSHRDILLDPSHNNVQIGSKVEFMAQSTAKGLNAVQVTAIGGGYCCGGRSKGTATNLDGSAPASNSKPFMNSKLTPTPGKLIGTIVCIILIFLSHESADPFFNNKNRANGVVCIFSHFSANLP